MKNLIRTFKQISILILAITFIGCEDDDAVLPQVVAGFTHTINADTGVVTFINISENGNKYSWDFGDDTNSPLINPVKKYPNGTYTVILTVTNVAGASDVFEDTITILIPEIATIPITFDGANTAYNADTFQGASFMVVDNPAPGGTNDVASKVGAITNSGAVSEGIVFELGAKIDLATQRTITINFWSDKPVNVLLKLEEGSASTPDVIASHTGSGWELLSFNFTSSSSYSKLVIFVDQPLTTTGTFYIDDILQIETPAPPCVDETEQSLSVADFNISFLAEDTTSTIKDEGAVLTRILNPDTDNDLNTSCYVGQIVRSPDAQFANNQIEFNSKLDFNANSGFKLKVWSATAGINVTLKIEDKVQGNTGPSAEVSVVTTVASGWEELTFDFASSDSDKFDRIVLFFELAKNVPGTYFIDDFMLYGEGSGGGDCVEDASQSLSSSDINLTFVTNPGTTAAKGSESAKFFQDEVVYEYVDNPDSSGAINNSCKVAKVTKLGVQPWDNLQIDFDDKFTFSDGDNFTIKVFSPVSGYNVSLKLEDKTNGDIKSEVASNTKTTKTNEWEELTIPFGAGDSGKFDRLVIFFDVAGPANTNTYYFDDLKLNRASGGGGGGGSTAGFPINFEDGINIFSAFEGATVGVIDNPQTTGNASSKVMELIKPAGTQFFAGINSTQGLGAPLVDLSNGMIFTVKIWSPKANANVRMRLEQEPGVINPPAYQIFKTVTNANEWTTLTFDFTDQAMSSYTYTRIVLNTDWDNGGDGQPFYIDDIEQSGATTGGGGTGGGTGGGGTAGGGGFTVNGDFETGTTTGYTVFDAEGGTFSVTNEEAQAGNFSGKLVATGATTIVVKQANINTTPALGPEVSVTISFDLKGSLTGAGGVVFAEFFSEINPEGVSKAEILGGGAPLFPTDTWTTYTYTTTTGDNVSGGVTLQLKASCGASTDCGVIAYFDNLSVTVNP